MYIIQFQSLIETLYTTCRVLFRLLMPDSAPVSFKIMPSEAFEANNFIFVTIQIDEPDKLDNFLTVTIVQINLSSGSLKFKTLKGLILHSSRIWPKTAIEINLQIALPWPFIISTC